jgi:hypothetical protein
MWAVTHYQIASIAPELIGLLLALAFCGAILLLFMLGNEDGVVRASGSMSFKHMFMSFYAKPAPEDQPPCPEIMFDN